MPGIGHDMIKSQLTLLIRDKSYKFVIQYGDGDSSTDVKGDRANDYWSRVWRDLQGYLGASYKEHEECPFSKFLPGIANYGRFFT